MKIDLQRHEVQIIEETRCANKIWIESSTKPPRLALPKGIQSVLLSGIPEPNSGPGNHVGFGKDRASSIIQSD
jgi:hypothetical protein